MPITTLVLAVTLACVSLGAAADSTPPGRDRARTYLMLRVVDALNLSDEKALEMREILRRADDRRLELTRQRDGLDARLRAAVAQNPIDDAAVTHLVAEARAVQRELADLPEHTFSQAQRILTTEQQAKFLLFRRDLQGEVRQALRKRAATPATTAAAAPVKHPH
jgi:Spy/CpxP family protein refolding chaperone